MTFEGIKIILNIILILRTYVLREYYLRFNVEISTEENNIITMKINIMRQIKLYE